MSGLAFWEGFHEYVRDHTIAWADTTSDAKWSKFMFDFLNELAKSLGFSAKSEVRAFGSRRFDLEWRRGNDSVVLEHENWGVKAALKDEIPKLAGKVGTLHVCITYVPAREFPGSDYVDECKRILEREGFGGELLLVLGTNDMTSQSDWVCHRIYSEPSLYSDTLVLPRPLQTTKGRGTRRASRSKRRAESGWERLKRAYPNSRSVTAALRDARRRRFTASYVRVLESLRRYWVGQGN